MWVLRWLNEVTMMSILFYNRWTQFGKHSFWLNINRDSFCFMKYSERIIVLYIGWGTDMLIVICMKMESEKQWMRRINDWITLVWTTRTLLLCSANDDTFHQYFLNTLKKTFKNEKQRRIEESFHWSISSWIIDVNKSFWWNISARMSLEWRQLYYWFSGLHPFMD